MSLIYMVQVYSTVTQLCIYIDIYSFSDFFSIIDYYKVLNIVPSAIQ